MSTIEAVTKLAKIHVQPLRAGSVIGAVDKRVCVADDVMELFQQLTVRIKHFTLVDIVFRQWLSVGVETIRLHN